VLGSAKLLGGLADMTVELGAGRVTMAVFQALKKAGRLAEVEKLIPAGQLIRTMDDVPAAFYSPSQPRDGEGKWSKTGGLGAGKHGTKVAGKPGWVHDANGRAVHGFGAEGKPLADILEQMVGAAGGDSYPVEDADSIAEELAHTFGERTGTLAGAQLFTDTGELEIEGVIEVPDENGDGEPKEIGTYQRTFMPDGEGGVRVYHKFLALNNKHQGQGVGSEFLKASEDYYRDLGVTEITLEANIDVGGFAWTRMGFDFQSGKTAKNFVKSASDVWEEDFTPKYDDGSPKFKADLAKLQAKVAKFDSTGDPADAPTAFEVSELGHTPGAKKWPGKALMLGSNWDGIKYLTYPETEKTTTLAEVIEAVTAFYDPSQPRDAGGKWSKTGGGGKAKGKAKAKQAMRNHTGPGAVSGMIKAGHLPTEKQVGELMGRWAKRVPGTKLRVVTDESGIPGEDGHIKTVTAHLDMEGDKIHVTFQKYRLYDKDHIATEIHVDDIRPQGATMAETMALGMHYHLSQDGLGDKAPSHDRAREEVRVIQEERNRRSIADYRKADRIARQEAAVAQEARRAQRKEEIKAFRDEHGPITELPPGRLQEVMKLQDLSTIDEASRVLEARAQEAFENLDLGPDVTASTGITQTSKIRMDYIVEFHNSEGRRIGFAQRNIGLDADNDEMYVYNSHMDLDAKWQGQGIAAKFTKASDEFHRGLGIHRVEVQANIDVGGYAWARLGFNWHPDIGGSHGSELTAKAIGIAIRDGHTDMVTKWAPKLAKFHATSDVNDLPTPAELSRLGWEPGKKKWAGKDLLLGANWQGVKRLDVSRETSMAELVTMFYSPTQPRDAGGRFARTGGGGLGGKLTKVLRKHMGGKNLRELLHSRTLEEHGDMLGDVDTSKLFVATAEPLGGKGMGLKLRETSPGIVQARLMDAANDRGDVLMNAGPSVYFREGKEMRLNIAPNQRTTMEDIDRLEKASVNVAAEMGYDRDALEMGSFELARQSIRDRARQAIEQKEFEKRRDAHKADLYQKAAAGDKHAAFAHAILEGNKDVGRVFGDVIAEDLNERLKGSGIKLEKQFTETEVNSLRNHYEIQDERGTRIGAATRTYYHDVDTKETRVVHDLLQMGAGVQGQGHGSKFLKASEDHYRESGVKQAEVYANIDVGGYAWARAGFQWDKTADMSTVMNNFEAHPDLLGPKAMADYTKLKDRAMKAYNEKIPSLMPTPYEFSEIGRGEIMPDYDMHAGKAFLLGAHWNGIKRYDTDVSRETKLTDGMVLTMFYSPSQPRDAGGKWSKGGGGGRKWKHGHTPNPAGAAGAKKLSDATPGKPEVFIDNTTSKDPLRRATIVATLPNGAGVSIRVSGGKSLTLHELSPHPDSPKLAEDMLVGVKEAGLTNLNRYENPWHLRQARRALKDGWTDGPMPVPEPIEPSYKGTVLKGEAAADHLKEHANFSRQDNEPLARYIKKSDINHELRKNGGGGEHELDDIIARQGENTEAYQVFRGVAHLPEIDVTGATLTDPAFTSTSLLQNVASRFTNGTIMDIMVPPGFKGAAVNLGVDKASGLANKALEGEAEVLFPRGTKIKILHDTHWGQLGNGRRLIAEMVSE
jgi:GNAT superfamily N-acetyltransferase